MNAKHRILGFLAGAALVLFALGAAWPFSATAGSTSGGTPALVPITSTLNYRIRYPAGWLYQAAGSEDTFIAPPRTEGAAATVRVSGTSIPAGTSDAAFLQFAEVAIVRTGVLPRVVGFAEVAGHRLTLVSYTGHTDIFAGNGQASRQMNTYIVAVLIVGATGWGFELATEPNAVSAMQPVFAAMLGTFQALKPPPSDSTSPSGGSISATTGLSFVGSQWTSRSSGTTHQLMGVTCPNLHLCVAVGAAGTILTSGDGGATWHSHASSTQYDLVGVTCLTGKMCLAAGDDGTIVASANGGSTWRSRASGTQNAPRSIACPTADECLIVGVDGTVLASTDGGVTWHRRSSSTGANLASVTCPTSSNCLVAGDGTMLISLDGGTTWIRRSLGRATSVHSYTGVRCTNTSLCVVVGGACYSNGYRSGIILHSTDGGATWTSAVSGALIPLSAVAYPGGKGFRIQPTVTMCVAVGDRGAILSSGDAGATWSSWSPVTNSELSGIACPSENQCVAVGAGGTIVRMTRAVPGVWMMR